MARKRALVVDDERFTVKIISDILTSEGYKVETALSGETALDYVEKVPFNVVITDIRMPGESGIELLEKIRSLNPDLPVIIMTGYASLESAVEAIHLGAFEYLMKPLDYNILKSTINNAVQRYELKRENERLVGKLRELNTNLELKVKERNRELENILSSTNESILTTDTNLTIKTANPKTELIFGEDIIGTTLTKLIPQIDFETSATELLNDPNHTAEVEIKRGDKFLHITLSSLSDFQTNHISGVIAVTRDITEQKNLEGQLIQSAKMSAVGQLAAGVAHEFNNILSGILGYTSLASSRTSIDQIKKDLDIVEKACKRATEIVSKLLSFSKQDKEKFGLYHVEEAIEDALVLIERTYESEQIEIVKSYGKTPRIKIDKSELQQVILNLAINAKHSMPKGGTIEIRTGSEGEYVKIDFRDTGAGIPEENLSRIFEPFFTTKDQEDTKSGSGLGLSVAYAIVERHGGKIDVSSIVGKGTTLSIRLPKVRCPVEEPKPAEMVQPDSNVQFSRSDLKANILVVDDEELVCSVMEELLTNEGHHIAVARSGEEALELLRKGGFDIVFLDLVMPRISGTQVLKEAKSLYPNLKVVIISARADQSTKTRLIEEGAYSFIDKPFSSEIINNTLAKIL